MRATLTHRLSEFPGKDLDMENQKTRSVPEADAASRKGIGAPKAPPTTAVAKRRGKLGKCNQNPIAVILLRNFNEGPLC